MSRNQFSKAAHREKKNSRAYYVFLSRKELQALSGIRLREARALARLGMNDGAYYLAGYAVECALKACIAK